MKLQSISGASLRGVIPVPKSDKGPPDLKTRLTPQEAALMPSEAAIQAAIIERLLRAGWVTVRVNSGGFRDAKGTFVRGYSIAGLDAISGFPDVMAFHSSGRFLLVECKKHDGELTDSQKEFIDYAAARGVPVDVLRHSEELEAILGRTAGEQP